MKYYIFNSLTGKRVFDEPVDITDANRYVSMKCSADMTDPGSGHYVVQGIYPGTRDGWVQYLQDNGLNGTGMRFEDFYEAMENGTLLRSRL